MANRLKGEASFSDEEFGDLTLRFDAEAILAIEDELGIGLMELGSAGKSMGLAASVLLIALRGNHPDLEMERADAAEMLMVNPAAQEAFKLAMERMQPKAQPGNGQQGKSRPKRGTGTRS